MDTPCKKCSADIDIINCLYTVCEDRCARKFHAACVGVTEDALCALSKNIIWICDDCMIEFCKARDHIPKLGETQPADKYSITADLEELKSQIKGINDSFAKLSIAIASKSSPVSTQRERQSTPIGSPNPLCRSSVCTSERSHSSMRNHDETFSLLLTNIDRHVTENEIACLVSQSLCAPEPECRNVTKLVPRWQSCDDLDYISFKIVLPKRWMMLAMSATTWPQGITFREFAYRNKDPWKPLSISHGQCNI